MNILYMETTRHLVNGHESHTRSGSRQTHQRPGERVPHRHGPATAGWDRHQVNLGKHWEVKASWAEQNCGRSCWLILNGFQIQRFQSLDWLSDSRNSGDTSAKGRLGVEHRRSHDWFEHRPNDVVASGLWEMCKAGAGAYLKALVSEHGDPTDYPVIIPEKYHAEIYQFWISRWNNILLLYVQIRQIPTIIVFWFWEELLQAEKKLLAERNEDILRYYVTVPMEHTLSPFSPSHDRNPLKNPLKKPLQTALCSSRL